MHFCNSVKKHEKASAGHVLRDFSGKDFIDVHKRKLNCNKEGSEGWHQNLDRIWHLWV